MAPTAAKIVTAENRDLDGRDGLLDSDTIDRESFIWRLHLEQKRAERSGSRFALMLLEADELLRMADATVVRRIVAVLSGRIRETDIKYADRSTGAIVFTEIGIGDTNAVMQSLFARVAGVIAETVPIEQVGHIKLSFQVLPGDLTKGEHSLTTSCATWPTHATPSAAGLAVKRAVDIAGSTIGLILLSPLLFLIAAAVKLTSKGPVLFCQQRLSQQGRKFTFLKFRSMFTDSDQSVHEQHMKGLILDHGSQNPRTRSYKLANDSRVTCVGRFLRRTSLDELPQLVNVLMGDMSLVGPRPPIPYEVDCYDLWHKRRLAMKPGLTGLWQVEGRSRLSFDEMVRLDLKYIACWSLALDCKILFKTPRAVVRGDGAC